MFECSPQQPSINHYDDIRTRKTEPCQTDGKITGVTIRSEKGSTLRLISPWGKNGRINRSSGSMPITTEMIILTTKPGELIRLTPY